MKLANIILEGLNLYEIEVIIKTDLKYNKIEIYNQIRAVKGVVIVKIEKENFLASQRTDKFEYSLLHVKYTASDDPVAAINDIKLDSLTRTKIIGLLQFIPRVHTILKKAQY